MTTQFNINWHLETRKIKDLKDYHKNPRKISKHDYSNLQASINEFGLVDKPIITKEGLIIGGHQRRRCLKALGLKEIECWVPDIDLNEKQIEKLNLMLNRVKGEFDYDILANEFDLLDLMEAGFTEHDFSVDDIKNITNPGEDSEIIKEEKKIEPCPKCGFINEKK